MLLPGIEPGTLCTQVRRLNQSANMHYLISIGFLADSVCDGIAVDSSRSKLFYTDAGRDVIVSMNLDGSGEQTIISSGLDQPRAIVFDTQNR